MPPPTHDLHGSAPDRHPVALLLVDVINDMDFPEADQLLEHAVPAADRLAALKARAVEAGVPVVYANDNFGRWRSDFRATVEHATRPGSKGKPLADRLRPGPDDYFVLKPKHSAFYHTALDLLLQYLGTKTVVVGGFAGNICVLFTANDAYMRDLRLVVPSDCLASNTTADNDTALDVMARLLKADTRPSGEVSFGELAGAKS